MNKDTVYKPSGRLASIDALRGFDMLMISGGGAFIFLLGGKTDIGFINVLSEQLEHPEWNGFTFYDFIFPLFLFLAGVSLSFSLTGGIAKGLPKGELIRKVFNRMLVLIVLGILDKNAPIDIFDPSQIRYGSVLGRIGLATFIVAVLFLQFSWKQRLLIGISVLIVYFMALLLIPVPGFGAGDLSFEGNLVGWFDRTFMPGRLKQKTYDELAILTQFPALCLTLFGSIAGDLLRQEIPSGAKLKWLAIAGAAGVLLGLVWDLVFPINKHLWSSSFICLTSGLSCLFVALFYWIIDVLGFVKWSFFFRVIGMNSLVIYLVMRFVDLNASSRLLFEGFYKHAGEKWMDVFNALGALIVVWLFLYFLYRKKIFVKV